jgi:hypothetical protein
LAWWESGRRLCGGNEIVDDEDPGPLRVAHGNLSGQALLLALDAMVGAQYTVSRACTSSNRFIIGVAGWKFVFGQEDVESLFFFKAQTLKKILIAHRGDPTKTFW